MIDALFGRWPHLSQEAGLEGSGARVSIHMHIKFEPELYLVEFHIDTNRNIGILKHSCTFGHTSLYTYITVSYKHIIYF